VTVLVTATRNVPNTVIDGVQVLYGKDYTHIAWYKPDVIFSHFQNTARALEVGRGINKPVVVVAHNDSNETRQLLNITKSRDLVVFNTNWLRNKMRPGAPSIVVHPPIDKEGLHTMPGDSVVLVNLTLAKGAATFYALAGSMPETKFLGVIGGYRKDIQVVRDLPNVTIIDSTSNMRDDVYAKARVVLMPSVYETFGMVAAEAISSGIPVVAHRTIGLEENLGDAGIFIDRDDHVAWRLEVARLVNDDDYYKTVSDRMKRRSDMLDVASELKQFVAAVERMVYGNTI
jgi:glycosyltransferase involved in cell wall biosynthesis